MKEYLDGRVVLHAGDCRDVIATLADCSIDSVVTDPPYALVSISKRFGKDGAAPAMVGKTGAYARASAGFMGKHWDTGEAAFAEEFWAQVLRVLKPGGHVLAFGGTRTYHRLACAIEDAGFEIRDQIGWAYGSGFPKSHNLGDGWGTALKPAWEPIVMARKAIEGTNRVNMAAHGVGGLNIDDCRVHSDDATGGDYTVKRLKPGATLERTGGNWRPDDGPDYHGHMQPGRWPANIIHDGSGEVLAAFPDAPGQQQDIDPDAPSEKTGNIFGKMRREGEASAESDNDGDVGFKMKPGARRLDSGSAARFFYSAKADADDRIGSKHPTVKPVDLMQYLVRLVTPKGGLVLDPFAGTGTTGEAAFREGLRAILIEREEEYQADIERRMELAQSPTKRAAVAKSKNKLQGAEGTPLFDL